jgi:hypothetical protein
MARVRDVQRTQEFYSTTRSLPVANKPHLASLFLLFTKQVMKCLLSLRVLKAIINNKDQ